MALRNKLDLVNSMYTVETPIVIPLRWRTKTITRQAVSNDSALSVGSASPADLFPPVALTYSAYQTGGSAAVQRTFSSYQNSGAFGSQLTAAVAKRNGGDYYLLIPGTKYTFTDITFEVDWATTFTALRAAYSAANYSIGVAKFSDISGNVDTDSDLVNEGLVTLNKLNSSYKDESTVPSEFLDLGLNLNLAEHAVDISIFGPTEPLTFQYLAGFAIKSLVAGDGLNAAAQEIFDSGLTNKTTSSTRTIPMYLKVWVSYNVEADAKEPDDQIVKEEDTDTETPGTDPVDWGSVSGGSGSTTKGSEEEGKNTFYVGFGNSNLPFDSVYLTGANYNSFLAAGGGIISNSGVFPNSEDIYIDKIRLDVEGSTMSIRELVEFDATPSLSLGEKIYGYILDETNTSQPTFAGYVSSIQRVCSGDTREINYECKDLTYYLDQLYTPSYYIYKPPSLTGTGVIKTYDRILKEILNVAGLQDASLSIPSYDAPETEWYYQTLRSVLEWGIKFLGKYVYYADKHGRLNIKATDSGSNVKTYTIGDKSGEIAIEKFLTVADNSRSRSSLIMTGDYEYNEKIITFTKRAYEIQEALPYTNRGSGVYYYTTQFGTQTIRTYYLIYNVGETIADHLISDPNTSVKAKIDSKTGLDVTYASDPNRGGLLEPYELNKELSPQIFTNSYGEKVIYAEDSALLFYGSITLTVQYATKSLAPIQVRLSTGELGGAEVIRRPEFKKLTVGDQSYDETSLMNQYLTQVESYYKPVYGGTLHLDGLDTDISLLDKVSIAGSDLPSEESDDLICYSIEYLVQEKRTIVDLSNKVYADLPFFDLMRDRTNANQVLLAKVGLLEQQALYNT